MTITILSRRSVTRERPIKVIFRRIGGAACIIGYSQNMSNLFHCPSLLGKNPLRPDEMSWTWNFNVDFAGYGYNGFFLGHHPYTDTSITVAGTTFTFGDQFKR